MYKVCVDAGHGGYDDGATGIDGIKEKELTLAVALDLEDLLVNDGRFIVAMTRSGDYAAGHCEGQLSRDLYERVKVANDFQADFFVSIHFNKFNGQMRGAQVLVSSKSEDKANKFANELLAQLKSQEGLSSRGVIETGSEYAVIRETNMSAVITESAFIDNISDASKFVTIDGQRQLAYCHYLGICKVFDVEPKNIDDLVKKIEPKETLVEKPQESVAEEPRVVEPQEDVQGVEKAEMIVDSNEPVAQQGAQKPQPVPVESKVVVNVNSAPEPTVEGKTFSVPVFETLDDVRATLESIIKFMEEGVK